MSISLILMNLLVGSTVEEARLFTMIISIIGIVIAHHSITSIIDNKLPLATHPWIWDQVEQFEMDSDDLLVK